MTWGYCIVCGRSTMNEDPEQVCEHGCCHAGCCERADGCPDSFD